MDGVDLDGSWGTTNLNPWRDQYLSMGGSIDGITSNPYGACFRDDINQVLAGPIEICLNAQQRMPNWGPNGITDYRILNNGSYDTAGNVSALILSDNLVDWQDWSGAVYGNDPGGCCSSISGSGAMIDNTTQTIMFSYGRDVLAQTIAINQALALSGISVDGYQYEWTYRLIGKHGSNNYYQVHTDELQFIVTVKDANGNEVEQYVYDYSGAVGQTIAGSQDWHTESGTEIFQQSYQDPQNIQLQIIGRDGGYWSGYYGPEVKDVALSLIYRSDPCAADPLYDPSCNGYAEAYAQQQYDLNCQANPLYDSGCPGYAQAYFDQQCSADPLYNASCPGYASAYFDYQCSLDPLFDATCPGYADALYAYECSADSLFDTGCPGYEAAYLEYQCSLDALYDRSCEGYNEAYAKENIFNEETTSTETQVSTAQTETVPVTDPEEIGMPSATGDSTVDSILSDLSDSPTLAAVVTEPVTNMEPEPDQQEEVEEVNEEDLPEPGGDVAEPMDSGRDTNEDGREESSEDSSEDDSSGDSESGESDSERKESKRDKMKKAVAKKAANLANDMSNAASLEAQQAVQATVLALINYVPDFDSYSRAMNGGYLPDAQMYQDEQLPESRSGLRNGLAQQLLHEQMIDMQYNRNQ